MGKEVAVTFDSSNSKSLAGDDDGDGIPDHLDADDDNDGIPDFKDDDDDGDGILDRDEGSFLIAVQLLFN